MGASGGLLGSIGVHPSEEDHVIALTDTAAVKVQELIKAEGDEALALRVAVRPGGCSGFSYEMFFDLSLIHI